MDITFSSFELVIGIYIRLVDDSLVVGKISKRGAYDNTVVRCILSLSQAFFFYNTELKYLVANRESNPGALA